MVSTHAGRNKESVKPKDEMKVITTSRLKGVKKLKPIVESWKRELYARTVLMVEEGECSLHEGELKEALSMFDEVLKYTPKSKPNGLCGKGPTLSEVLRVCQASADAEIVLFLNADIEIASCKYELGGRMKDQLEIGNLMMIQRMETDESRKEIRRYQEGYDGFAMHTDKKVEITEVHELMRIGQVGWDYALPLSMDRRKISVWPGSEFRHKMHETGSSLQWEDAMTRICHGIDKTWTSRSEKKRKMAVWLAKIMLGYSDLGKQRFNESKNAYKKALSWLGSRILYYGFIRGELSSLSQSGRHKIGSYKGIRRVSCRLNGCLPRMNKTVQK